MVHLEEDVEVGKELPLACVLTAVWGMLIADDAGIVLKSVEGVAKMITNMVTFFEAAAEKTMETMFDHRPWSESPHVDGRSD